MLIWRFVDPLQSTISEEDKRYEALSYENEQLRAEVQRTSPFLFSSLSSHTLLTPLGLRADLASSHADLASSHAAREAERAARSALENSQQHLAPPPQYWDYYGLGEVKGISPASVPAIMEAFVRLAQLTDRVMCVDVDGSA